MRTKPVPSTSIARSDANDIFVREANLVEELIGEVTFTEMILLHFYGRKPTRAETRVLDCVLVTLMEHGITPSALGPTTRAADWNSTSTDGLWRLTSGPSRTLTRYCAPLR